MKRLIAILLLLSGLCTATTVTLQVTDLGGQTWSNGTYSAKVSGTTSPIVTGSLSGTGGATVTLGAANWIITVCPQATASCYAQAVVVVGGSQNITLTPPAIGIVMVTGSQSFSPPARVSAYNVGELLNPQIGSMYYDITLQSVGVCEIVPCSTPGGWVYIIAPANGPLLSVSFPNADRCAGIITAINQSVNGVSGDPVDARNEIATGITCNSNMLPSNFAGTSNSSAAGGELQWPSGQFNVAVGQQLAVNQFHVTGIGLGLLGGTGTTMLAPTAGFAFGAGTSYNPAVLAFGANAGQINTGLGPFSSSIDHFKVDCNPLVAPAGITGVTYFSGQENTYLDYFGIDHCPAASLSIGGGSNSTGNGGKISNFYIQHSGTNGNGSCPVPAAFNVQSWSYNGTTHVVTVTATGGSPVPQLGHGALITGLATGGNGVLPNHGVAHVCAIGTVSDDITCQGLSLGANQYAYIYNGGATNDSSAVVQGTMTVYPVGIRVSGQANRSIKDGSLIGTNCPVGGTPLTNVDVSTSTPLLVEAIHPESSQTAVTLGTEANTLNVTLLDVQPSNVTGTSDGVKLMASAGFITGPVDIFNLAAKLGMTNSIIDEWSGNTLTHNINAAIGMYLTDANGQGIVTNALPEAGIKNAFDFHGNSLTVYGGAIASSVLVFGGTGYGIGDVVSIQSPTGGNNANVIVNTIGGGGAVLTYTMFNPGSGYVQNYQATALTPATGFGPSQTNNITNGSGTGFTVNVTAITSTQVAQISETGLTTQIASAIYMTVDNSINSGIIAKISTITGNVVRTTVGDTAAGLAIGVMGPGGSFGGGTRGPVITSGVITMLNETGGGSGSCGIGSLVVVSPNQNGAPHCTAIYTAGTVIGTALNVASPGAPVNVLVGLR